MTDPEQERCANARCRFHTQPLVWNGKPLPLRTDHRTGRKLCPSCYSLRHNPGAFMSDPPTLEELAELAKSALGDAASRKRHPRAQEKAGSKVWREREPQLAAAVLRLADLLAELDPERDRGTKIDRFDEQCTELAGVVAMLVADCSREMAARLLIAFGMTHAEANVAIQRCNDGEWRENIAAIRDARRR